ncbi:discoidin domain-containing protein [Cerasicoccus frondis]|uniref:discoidin domain-containing protein n=1 Tax=Cerasicoccus frondis TaxID=490090 RepID=UPI0028526F07|nr:discoidin domain-containing protein [Cerasicoccus frondis]
MKPKRLRQTATYLVGLMIATSAQAQSRVFPSNSKIASPEANQQQMLLSALELDDLESKEFSAGVRVRIEPSDETAVRSGNCALKLSADMARIDHPAMARVLTNPVGQIDSLGLWVSVDSDSNAKRVGLILEDANGEQFSSMVNADWQSWEWVELGIDSFQPISPKDGNIDQPLKRIFIAWEAAQPGNSMIEVDALTALASEVHSKSKFKVTNITPPWGEPGTPFTGALVVHNFQDEEMQIQFSSSLQTNPQYLQPSAPDPIYGTDISQGKTSWVVFQDQRIDDLTLTDGEDDTLYQPTMPKEGLPEIFQVIDLGQATTITGLELKPGDGNWIRKVDIAASTDGKHYEDIAELQNIDLEKNWNFVNIDVPTPFQARLIRIRHHDKGENLPGLFRALAASKVYNGVADEAVEIPTVGELVQSDEVSVSIPARSFKIVKFKPTDALQPNAYQFGYTYDGTDGLKIIKLSDYFVMPEGSVKIRPESRFGINTNSPHFVPKITRIGFGWVRFENMKWPFYNPAPDDFRFDGSVAPWNVPFDEYYTQYNEAGLSILPYIFESPKWATSAPDKVTKNRRRYPPTNYADYGKAIFQAVARYGSNHVSDSELLSNDKRAGLDFIKTYELWNEPNLNAASWGFFVGELEEFYELYRVGAEALKKADPQAQTSNGGWAGISMDFIGTMESYHYEDGKTPLDFTDVLSVHFYTGKQDPETATRDPNANRSGKSEVGSKIIEEYLIDLSDWRNQCKPDMPIWVTEMGYDVGGPIGRTERHQGAKLPRATMMALANGIEKVMLYRIAGSTPSHHGGAGLIRNDGSLRASFFTMANLIRQLDDVTDPYAPRLHTGDANLWLYYWRKPSGNMLSAHVPSGEAKLGLDLGPCVVTNAFGGKSQVNVTKDFVVGEYPVYISQISNQQVIDGLLNQAIAQEVARRKKLEFLAQTSPYLFDFGSHEDIGSMKVGKIRTFTTVTKQDLYDSEKGHGFLDKVSGKDINAGWVKSMLDKDSIQLHRSATFQVDAAPGQYLFQFKGSRYRDNQHLIISGGQEGAIDVPIPSETDAPTEPLKVTVLQGQPLKIELPAANAQWLTLTPVYTN